MSVKHPENAFPIRNQINGAGYGKGGAQFLGKGNGSLFSFVHPVNRINAFCLRIFSRQGEHFRRISANHADGKGVHQFHGRGRAKRGCPGTHRIQNNGGPQFIGLFPGHEHSIHPRGRKGADVEHQGARKGYHLFNFFRRMGHYRGSAECQ